eukprot:CAMPEP_0178420118 /NCGR_PEP_ID=MMETSP0689_2-20121128/25965_1 /TAXON_ID=160604 /ORGANISM="Amphidinium massartii, Strain CS-259" /LENGTH=610 /DNA_ID=CAMNT_0020041585 /DNA_START=115 /DNA_END=1944 /DNA_ORIENTATION=+
MASKGELITNTFSRFDQNGDGFISRSELTKVLQCLRPGQFSPNEIDKLMDVVDTNKDGKIQYAEFVAWIMKEAEQGQPAGAKSDAKVKARGIDIDFRTLLPERFEVDIEKRYALDKLQLGEGGYGKVFIATDKEFSDRKVAVKRVTRTGGPRSTEADDALYEEIKVMKELDHPNICKLLATFEQKPHMFFIMELCEGGEVFDRIIAQGYINEAVTADIIAQVCAALHYAHGRGIAHRDIKPENLVFCTKDPADTRVKLIDWGLAQSFLGSAMVSAVGSFTYAAPEVITSGNVSMYTEACDLWSLGVLAYVMLCGRPPFFGSSQAQQVRNAMAEKYPMKDKPWKNMNPHAKDFVVQLLKADPKKRLPIAECCKHPWLTRANAPKANTDPSETAEVFKNLKHFSNSSTFSKMCITAVARQLDHTHLKSIHQVFRELDVNGDGVLSFEEISQGFKKMFGADSVELKEVQNTFEQLDLDGSDAIDYTEFCAAGLGQKASSQEDIIWAAFKTFDLDNSGYVTTNELQKILDSADVQDEWTPEVCGEVSKAMISSYDRDGDGKISFEDWKAMMRKQWDAQTAKDQQQQQQQQAEKMPQASSFNPYDLLLEVNKLPD